MANKKRKEGVKTENNDHINLKVAGQDGSVVQFKIKRHTPLSKLMKAYCERQDIPAQVEMKNEDTTDVYQQHTGGI
ncbi:small ubiquitin-related modifier 2-like isoform X2 [Meles meles]|uniref:small ubiquitin-related modifier 2-like isoform X2 n=1 Tax=Meles meles TaxID=9662 RepID=UPI001E69C8CB|nr:small ubiquitin-related modifier 2-like isoform X2 [Meles meles]